MLNILNIMLNIPEYNYTECNDRSIEYNNIEPLKTAVDSIICHECLCECWREVGFVASLWTMLFYAHT